MDHGYHDQVEAEAKARDARKSEALRKIWKLANDAHNGDAEQMRLALIYIRENANIAMM